MRFLVPGILTCLGAAAATSALADPPSTQSQTSSPAASAPAASTPTKSTSLKDEFTPDENHFIQEGYHLEMHHGERTFCRYEVSTESRVERHKFCGTVDQLKASEAASQRAFGPGQTQSSSH